MKIYISHSRELDFKEDLADSNDLINKLEKFLKE